MTDTSQNALDAGTHGGPQDSGLDAPKALDFPSQVHHVADKKFFDRVLRPQRVDNAPGDLSVVSFFLAREGEAQRQWRSPGGERRRLTSGPGTRVKAEAVSRCA